MSIHAFRRKLVCHGKAAMSDRIHSFGGLGKAIQEEALKIALKCCHQGDNDNAVEAFDLIKDLSSLEMSVK